MKKIKKIALFLTLYSSQTLCDFSLHGPSFISPRSQSTNGARELAGIGKLINRFDARDWYGVFWLTPEYGQSFRRNRLAEYFFFTDILTFTGSQVAMRDDNDILADYWGLSPIFQSTVKLRPQIQTGLI